MRAGKGEMEEGHNISSQSKVALESQHEKSNN